MPRRSLTALALAAAFGCHRLPTGAIAVGSLHVSEANLAGAPELGISVDKAQAALRWALESTGKFAVRPRGARIRLEVEHARRTASSSGEQAEVSVSLEMLPEGEGERLVAEGVSRRPADAALDPQARAAAFDAALRAAAGEAAQAIAYQVEARRKPDPELVRDLASADPRLRDYAVRVLADRRNPAVVPSLIARLNDESPVIVLRAIGALVAIGDKRAVRPLIELTKKRPAQVVAQILYALGSLGGPEAEAFLFTLESGSPDEEVRRAAAEAFADLRRKQTEAAARARHEP